MQKKSYYQNISTSVVGFTLIELIIVITVTAILITVGTRTFIQYNQSQQLNIDVGNLENTLQTAKSLANSYVVTNAQTGNPYCLQGSFNGYYVYFLTATTYQLWVSCSSPTVPQSPIDTKIGNDKTLLNSTISSPSTPFTIGFQPNGLAQFPGTDSSFTITISSKTSKSSQNINVTTPGVIQVSN